MILLSTLLFFAHLLTVSADQTLILDAGCDDSNIIDAVDVALKSYNAGIRQGNQYILHRITKAGIRTDSNRIVHHYVDYVIHEGNCDVDSSLDWKECNFRKPKPALYGCSAHITVNEELKSNDVISQNCSLPVVGDVVVKETTGSFKLLNSSRREVLKLVELTIDSMNSLGNHAFHFGLEKIDNAWLQDANGSSYRLEYSVRKTNCSKSNFKTVRSGKCSLDENGVSGTCSNVVQVSPEGQKDITALNCKTNSGYCLNCPNAIEQNDPELLNLLVQFIDEFNANNNHSFLHKLSRVREATKEGSQPTKYKVNIEIKETNCSKTEYALLGDECDFNHSSSLLNCDVKMDVTDETVVHSHTCRSAAIFFLRIQGLSPLRSPKWKRDHGAALNHEEHGKKEAHRKKDKGNKKKYSADHIKVTTTVHPSRTTQKCPGKVWQPNLKQPSIPSQPFPVPPS